MEKTIIGGGNNRILLKSITKGKRPNTNFSHPAYTRYPHLKEKGPTDPEYTEWQKWFAWKPVKCLDGERAWLKYVYKRERTIKWTPPQFPPDAFNRTEYSTWEGILNMRMR